MAIFTVADYAVLLVTLFTLAAIGLYYRYTGGKQRSTEEYLLGDRSQRVLPVALSLVASHMSGISIVGVPAEVYYRGAIYCVANISLVFVIPITVRYFLPVFFQIGSSSAFEYLERRFGRRTRALASCLFPLQSVLFMAVVLYAPALALRTLSGLPTFWSVVIVGSTCTFYSSIGGIKAVIMTDVFQFSLTILSVLAIIMSAYMDKGSFENIWKIAAEGGRLNFSNFSLDPTERHTWWSLVIGAMFTYMGSYAIHPAQVQRYLTLRDYKTAARTLYISWPITSIFSLSMAFAGLCVYSRYHDCDPLEKGDINSQDQLVPFFVMDALGHLPGLPGLMVAGIFSASLSTISANLNSLATVTTQDYIKPVYEKCKKMSLPEAQALVFTKMLTVGYGVLLMVIAYLAHLVASILQTGLSLVGLVGGPTVAIFILGLFVPLANENGAIAGLLSGLALSFWLSFGGPKPPIANLPASISRCHGNITNKLVDVHVFTPVHPVIRPDEYLYLYRMSYWWHVVLSFLLALLVGLLVSLCTPSSNTRPDPSLFSPPVAARLRKKTQSCYVLQYKTNKDDDMT